MSASLPKSIRRTFIALKYPNYRLWFGGQLISLVGTWMQATAQGYLVYTLTGSAKWLGLVGFAAGVPSWLFTLYGGVIADRIPRRRLMIITQSVMMMLAFILAALVYKQIVQPWQIVVLAFLLGIANAFDAPARQSFVVELVDRKDLTNAIAINSTMFNLATVVGCRADVRSFWCGHVLRDQWAFLPRCDHCAVINEAETAASCDRETLSDPSD
jgi:MFS family permease